MLFRSKGKQVRDNIHSSDLVSAFWNFFEKQRAGEVYNMGGSRHSNCSMLEAIAIIEELIGDKVQYTLSDQSRAGDHIWWISDVAKFQSHYPAWKYRYDIRHILEELTQSYAQRSR